MLSKKTLSLATLLSVTFAKSERMKIHFSKNKLQGQDWINTWMFQHADKIYMATSICSGRI